MMILRDEELRPPLKGVTLQLCQVIALRCQDGRFEQSKVKLKVSRRLLYARYVLYVLYVVVALAYIIKLTY
jgi:hypothetical protein